MKIAELAGSFPFGVLLVTDEGSVEQIPEWDSDEAQVSVAQSALVARVRNSTEGPVEVFVWRDEDGIVGTLAYDATLKLLSGTLLVGDATGDQTVRIPLGVDSVSVQIFLDRAAEATRVDLLLLD